MNSCPRAPAPVLSPNCDARLLMSSPSAEMAAVLKERSGLQRLRNSETTGPSEDWSPDTEEMNCSQSRISIVISQPITAHLGGLLQLLPARGGERHKLIVRQGLLQRGQAGVEKILGK